MGVEANRFEENGSIKETKLKVLMRKVKDFDLLTKLRVSEDAQIRRSAVYKWAVDNVSQDTLATAVFSITESLSGMNSKEVLESRAIFCGLGLFMNRPYGMYRDFVFKLARVKEDSSQLKKTVVDMFALESFWMPVYGAWLYAVNRGDLHKTMPAVLSGGVIDLFYARPVGMWIDQVRKWGGVRSKNN